MKKASLELTQVPNGDKIEQVSTILQNCIIDADLKPCNKIPSERQFAAHRASTGNNMFNDTNKAIDAHGKILSVIIEKK